MTVETYQWFVRNAGKVSDAYTIVICDEAHTALGEKTSASIRQWIGPVFVGHDGDRRADRAPRHGPVPDADLALRPRAGRAARRDRAAALACASRRAWACARSRTCRCARGEVDQDFDQEELAALLDQTPFNLAVADLYKTRFKDLPGVVYSAGVKHAHNVAKAFQ